MKKTVFRLSMTVLCLLLSAQTVLGTQLLVPGGQVIGIEVQDNTVTVAAFDEQLGQSAKSSGLQVGDRITCVNGRDVHTAQDVREALIRSNGQAELTVLRKGEQVRIVILPQITNQGPKLGVYLKQGVTGVGTVTWYDPQTGSFGALGHGVNAADGNLAAMEAGNVYQAKVVTVKSGKAGEPGQLMSSVSGAGIIGSLQKNSPQGVFGTARLALEQEPLPVAASDQVRTGKATIRSTVKENGVQEYSVEILKLYPNSDTRNMLVKVTDPALLQTTGGIVQGMSGSPLVQDGKLIGAVTHVLVNDPTMGYGIFIENMLEAAG